MATSVWLPLLILCVRADADIAKSALLSISHFTAIREHLGDAEVNFSKVNSVPTDARQHGVNSVNLLRPEGSEPASTGRPAVRPRRAFDEPSTSKLRTTTQVPETLSDEITEFKYATLPKWVLLLSMLVCATAAGLIHYYMMQYGTVTCIPQSQSLLVGTTISGKNKRRSQLAMVEREVSSWSAHKTDEVPWQQYWALGFWELLMLAQCSFTRLVCQYGIPRDCQPHSDFADFVSKNHMILTYGFLLAILTGISQGARFTYVFNFKRHTGYVFMVVFFLASPVFGSLDRIEKLSSFSLTTASSWNVVTVSLLILVTLGFASLGIWHVVYAYKKNVWEGFVAYVAIRGIISLIFVSYFVCSKEISVISFHMHHYAVGFIFAMLAEFNHPLSLVLLAAGAGVMVQGLAAYGADPIMERTAF